MSLWYAIIKAALPGQKPHATVNGQPFIVEQKFNEKLSFQAIEEGKRPGNILMSVNGTYFEESAINWQAAYNKFTSLKK